MVAYLAHNQKESVQFWYLQPILNFKLNIMLIIITDKWEFQTKDSKQSILDQMSDKNPNNPEITFAWPVNSLPLEWGLHSCDEEITLHLWFVQILWFKEYVNIEKVVTEIELTKLEERIKEDTERADSLKEAMQNPEFIEIQELKKELKEKTSAFDKKFNEAEKEKIKNDK